MTKCFQSYADLQRPSLVIKLEDHRSAPKVSDGVALIAVRGQPSAVWHKTAAAAAAAAAAATAVALALATPAPAPAPVAAAAAERRHQQPLMSPTATAAIITAHKHAPAADMPCPQRPRGLHRPAAPNAEHPGGGSGNSAAAASQLPHSCLTAASQCPGEEGGDLVVYGRRLEVWSAMARAAQHHQLALHPKLAELAVQLLL